MEQKSDPQNTQELVDAVCEMFDVDILANKGDLQSIPIRTERSPDPVKMYDDNNFLLSNAFPIIFMFGKTHGSKKITGPLSHRQCFHLLTQSSTIPPKCKELYFLLYSQFICDSNNMGIHAKLKQNEQAFKDFSALTRSVEFRDNLKQAIANPASDIAKSIVKQVTPILAFKDNVSSYTPFDATESKGKMLAMARRYGGVSAFITIAPDSINNPTSFRMSL